MSHIREGLGYSLRYYNPCFSYNADRFCCSERGARFRENVTKAYLHNTKSDSYSVARNYNPNDRRPLWLQQTGLVDPDPYTFTPQDHWHIWCGRLPCSVDPISRNHSLDIPCQKTQPMCSNPGSCSK